MLNGSDSLWSRSLSVVRMLGLSIESVGLGLFACLPYVSIPSLLGVLLQHCPCRIFPRLRPR